MLILLCLRSEVRASEVSMEQVLDQDLEQYRVDRSLRRRMPPMRFCRRIRQPGPSFSRSVTNGT